MPETSVCVDCDHAFHSSELIDGRCFICRVSRPVLDIRTVAQGVPVI